MAAYAARPHLQPFVITQKSWYARSVSTVRRLVPRDAHVIPAPPALIVLAFFPMRSVFAARQDFHDALRYARHTTYRVRRMSIIAMSPDCLIRLRRRAYICRYFSF